MPLRAALSIVLLALASCEYGAGVAPAARPRISVHAVLNAGAAEQVLLVERTLVEGRHCASALADAGGAGELSPCSLDRDDPIVGAGGEPLSGSEVVVYGPAGDSAVAVEDVARRGDGKGAGVYRFVNGAIDASRPLGEGASLDVVPGRTYRLRVTTSLGTATAHTLIPTAAVAPSEPTLAFNVERGDVVRRGPVAATGAAAYLAVLDAPVGQRLRFLFEKPVALVAFSGSILATDGTDPKFGRRLQSNLAPGLRMEARTSALDSNYVRALRAGSGEDPFSSENPGNSIEGGVGVFGSLVPLSALRLDVVSFIDEPIEGRYVIVDGPPAAPRELRIFSYRGALSGSFAPSDGSASALFGARGAAPPVRLDFYSDRFDIVRSGSFEGRYSGGELLGTFTPESGSGGVATVYRHAP